MLKMPPAKRNLKPKQPSSSLFNPEFDFQFDVNQDEELVSSANLNVRKRKREELVQQSHVADDADVDEFNLSGDENNEHESDDQEEDDEIVDSLAQNAQFVPKNQGLFYDTLQE